MTFFIQGPNGNERMSLARVFKGQVVKKTEATAAEHALDEQEDHGDAERTAQQYDVVAAYTAVKHQSQAHTVVLAEAIMSSPVAMLDEQASIDQALALFRERGLRHLPVVSNAGLLLGIISDRDVLRHLSGITAGYQAQARHNSVEQVAQLMRSPVLTASMDTDVRYVARLFVEQHIGALPIMADNEMKGIITRSDVLKAVMRHFVLDLWA